MAELLDIPEEDYRALSFPAHSDLRSWIRPTTGLPPRQLMLRTAFHCRVLQPDLYRDLYYEWDADPSLATKQGKEMLQEVQDRVGRVLHEGEVYRKIVLRGKEVAEINRWVEALKQCPEAMRLLRAPRMSEATATAELADDDGGVLGVAKGLIDGVLTETKTPVLFDLKSTFCANEKEFEQKIVDYHYHSQSAYYTDLLAAIVERHPRFFWVCVSTKHSYAWVSEMQPHHYWYGRDWYQSVLRLWYREGPGSRPDWRNRVRRQCERKRREVRGRADHRQHPVQGLRDFTQGGRFG